MSHEQVAQTASLMSYAAGVSTIIAGLSLSEWMAIGGFLFGVLTYFTNLYFKRRQHKREMIEHELRLKRLRAQYKSNDNVSL